MFTGIITHVARLLAITPRRSGARLVLQRPADMSGLTVGESLAVSGVCLTVLPLVASGELEFDVSPETLSRTTLGERRPGDPLNLERAMAVGDRFGGHIVSGHVDTTTRVVAREEQNDFATLSFALDPSFSRYVVEKGSIALDGVSLTIARLTASSLDVAVIPHTLSRTTLGEWSPGRRVNVEVDMIARYVERMLGDREMPERTSDDHAAARDERLRRLVSGME
jgi:riboflavin synthase